MLYTGSNEIELLIKGLDSGARGYALKEGTQVELRTALTTVAEGGTYVDPRLHPALLSRRATQTQRVLSKREREIMDLLAQGLTGEQVAERLFLSPETIKTHIRNAMNKLEANTRVHAIAIALREGFISAPDRLVSDDDLVLDAETRRRLRHDLRTPLTIVAGLRRGAGRRPQISDADRREFARRIQDAAAEIGGSSTRCSSRRGARRTR